MQLSETVKVYPTEYQKNLIVQTMTEYIGTVNSLVFDAVSGHSIAKITTADVSADLPSALLNQCIRDAKSIIKKHYKYCHTAVLKNRSLAKRGCAIRVKAPSLPVMKKPCCYINNQNYKIKDNCIDFPVMINGKSKRISVSVKLTDRQKSLFSDAKFGTMRIVTKNQELYHLFPFCSYSHPFKMIPGSNPGWYVCLNMLTYPDISQFFIIFFNPWHRESGASKGH